MSATALFRGFSALATAALILAGCTDSASPTESGPPVLTTPTPASSGNIAGAWMGTWSSDDPDTCVVSGVAAQATFEQDGSTVRGTFSSAAGHGGSVDPCGLITPLAFTGTLINGDFLVGKTQIGGVDTFGGVQGVLSGSTLEIGLGVNSFGYASAGKLHLHR